MTKSELEILFKTHCAAMFRLAMSLFYVEDIFKTCQERWTIYGISTNITKDGYNYDCTLGLTVTYNSNVIRSKYKGTGAGNNDKSFL